MRITYRLVLSSVVRSATMMANSKSIVSIVLLYIYATVAIRTLKEGPMTGPDSREYRTALLPKNELVEIPASKASPVKVLCTERSMIVIVLADLYSNGRRVTANELRLGRSTIESCEASKYTDSEYVIEADLHHCGSKLSVEGDHLVYSNQLFYTPVQSSFGIIRTNGAAIPIECHYKRTHYVSSDVRPSWEKHIGLSSKSPMELIRFTFQLMNDNWRTKRSSYVYHLGEVMNVQASFFTAENAPFRLIVDSCVATLEPDSTSFPRYMFIQNHGCLIESKAPNSHARFMPRKQNHILQMQIEAFRFNEERNSIYITCHLKIVDLKLDIMNKACTYTGNRWLSVDGRDEICECCETVCDVNQKQNNRWRGLPKRSVVEDSARSKIMTLGPIKVID